MNIRELLQRHARTLGEGRARRMARLVVLLGGTGVAALLFLQRAGLVDLGWLPDVAADTWVGFLAISLVGLLQGAALLAVVFVVALCVREFGARFVRPSLAGVASRLGRALRTDRFAAALEARGVFARYVEQDALRHAPRGDLFAGSAGRWQDRWLRRLVIALVLIIALSPGAAPGEDGDAPVAGAPEDGGREQHALVLRLTGEAKTFKADAAVPVDLTAEARVAPAEDLHLPVVVRIDDGPALRPADRIFLAAGAPGQHSVSFDLRALARDLAPGKHRAQAWAGAARSNVYEFEIEPPGGQGGKPPDPKPQPKQPQPNPRDGGGPRQARPRYVEPLVREGRKVEKEAQVPIEVPEGGGPTKKPLREAWPELERRKEAALNRGGLSPAARKLVREYFDRLRPEPPK